MAYFNSGNVDVFPSTYRKEYPVSKLTSEDNFVNIINSITDNVGESGYVLDYSETSKILKVVIHGYYFEVKGVDIKTEHPTLWLGINVEQGGYSLVRYDNNSPENLDKDNSFYGLMYNDSEQGFKDDTNDNKFYKLQVAKNSEIINKVKFSIDSINYSTNRSLKAELDSKQFKIKAGNGIDTITNNRDSDNIVGLKQEEQDKLDALDLAKGSTGKRIYFNNKGIVQESEENIGKFNAKSGTLTISQNVYVVGGITKPGQTIYASTQNPSGGNPGDIWFKYVN